MPPDVLFGVDIGTTGCKTVAATPDGQILAQGISSYPIVSPRPGWADQDPNAVVEGVIASVRACARECPAPPAALCLTGALHSLLAVNKRGQPTMPALTWADARSTLQVRRLQASPDYQSLYPHTGCPLHPMYPLVKLLWLRDEQPETFYHSARFVSVKEFVLHALTGAWCADTSVASGSGLLNVHSLAWDDGALALAGIYAARLSPLVEPSAEIGALKASVARRMGLPARTRVLAGASDAALSNVGAGAVEPGVAVAMIGSSGALRLITAQPRLDERERTWCYVLDRERWIVGGALNNGGVVLQWFADRFQSDAPGALERVLAQAETVAPGAAGLVFLPFLAGERSPGWNADARGVLFGLSLHHTQAHIARALLESIGYRLRSVLDPVQEIAGRPREIRGSGGFLQSTLWVQIIADVLGRPLGIPSTPNTSALGAAFFGWHALGAFPWSDIARKVPIARVVEPDPACHALYSELYALYLKLYAQLGPSFADISRFQAALP